MRAISASGSGGVLGRGPAGTGSTLSGDHQKTGMLGCTVPVGGMRRCSRLKLMTFLNTGAASWPPKWPLRGFCRKTAMTSRGESAGAMPMNEAV